LSCNKSTHTIARPVYASPASKHIVLNLLMANNNTITYFTYLRQDGHDGLSCVYVCKCKLLINFYYCYNIICFWVSWHRSLFAVLLQFVFDWCCWLTGIWICASHISYCASVSLEACRL